MTTCKIGHPYLEITFTNKESKFTDKKYYNKHVTLKEEFGEIFINLTGGKDYLSKDDYDFSNHYPTKLFYHGHKHMASEEEERGFEDLVCVWDKETRCILDFDKMSQEQKVFCKEYFNLGDIEGDYRAIGFAFHITGEVSVWRGGYTTMCENSTSFNDLFKYSDEI